VRRVYLGKQSGKREGRRARPVPQEGLGQVHGRRGEGEEEGGGGGENDVGWMLWSQN